MHGFQLKLMDFYGVTIVPKSSVLCFVSYHSINILQHPNKHIWDFFYNVLFKSLDEFMFLFYKLEWIYNP